LRHRKSGKKLGRNTAQRKSLLRNLITSLFLHEEIKTTVSKAKAIKKLVDKLITKAKKKTLHHQRLIHAFLQNKKATKKLVEEIAPRFKKRTSGFTKIIRLGKRRGDNAPLAKIKIIAPSQKQQSQKEKEKKKKKQKM